MKKNICKFKKVFKNKKFILIILCFALIAIMLITSNHSTKQNTPDKYTSSYDSSYVDEIDGVEEKEETTDTGYVEYDSYENAESNETLITNPDDNEQKEDLEYLNQITKAIARWIESDGRYENLSQGKYKWFIQDCSGLVDQTGNDKFANLWHLHTYVNNINDIYNKAGELWYSSGSAITIRCYATWDGGENVEIHFLNTSAGAEIDDGFIDESMKQQILSYDDGIME